MVRGLVVVSCLVGCTPGVQSCPEGKYPSASGDCEEKQDGGSQYSGGSSGGGGGDDTAWGGDDTGWGGDDTGGGGGGAPEVNVDQNESGVRLTVQPGGYYYFGMAETDAGSSDPWTGEDCYYGYSTGSDYYQFCHPVDGDGIVLPNVTSIEDLDEYSTLFGNVSAAVTTYYLVDYSTYTCYTWGHDTSYYYGCIEL